MSKSLFALLLILGSITTVTPVVADSVMSWSEFESGTQDARIYLRRESKDKGIVERRISGPGIHITPTLQMDGSILWLAWIDRSDPQKYVLNYAVVLADTLSLIERGSLRVEDDQVYAPSITISPQGTPWLAWAGFDGKDEEIKISHYENGRWVQERAVTDNDVPDSIPRFNIQLDGSLLLSWEQTTPTAIITKREQVAAIENYADSLKNPSAAIIRYKKRMSGQAPFDAFKNLPDTLNKRKQNVYMGSRVELRK